MRYTTRRAYPFPHRQILCTRPLSTTGGAELTGRKEPVYRDYLFPVPCCLILQLPPKFTPTCVGDCFRQLMVFDHVGRSQILNRNQIIVPHKAGRQFMENILPLVGDMLVQSCHLKSCFFPAVAPLCFSGELTLEFRKLFFDSWIDAYDFGTLLHLRKRRGTCAAILSSSADPVSRPY